MLRWLDFVLWLTAILFYQSSLIDLLYHLVLFVFDRSGIVIVGFLYFGFLIKSCVLVGRLLLTPLFAFVLLAGIINFVVSFAGFRSSLKILWLIRTIHFCFAS